MERFLMDTNEVSSISGELSSIINSLSSISSKVGNYDVSFKGNYDKFLEAKKILCENINAFSDKIVATQKYMNDCVDNHLLIQKITYNEYMSNPSILKNDVNDESSSSYRKGRSHKKSTSPDIPVTPDLENYELLEPTNSVFESIVCENGSISEDVLKNINGVILIPETMECIAPEGYLIDSYVVLSMTGTDLDNKLFKVTQNYPAASLEDTTVVKAVIASTSKEMAEKYNITSGVVSKVGVKV